MTSHNWVITYIANFEWDNQSESVRTDVSVALLYTDKAYVTQTCIDCSPILEKNQPSGNTLFPSRCVDGWGDCCAMLKLHSSGTLAQDYYEKVPSG